MKALPRHHRQIKARRILCLVLMAILLANPVLAMISATLACNGQCCCDDAEETAAVTIRSNAPALAACCRSTDAAPCNMSAAVLPVPAPALVHPPDRQSTDPAYLLSGNGHAAADQLQFTSPGSRVASVLAIPDPPLYLRTCRLIC